MLNGSYFCTLGLSLETVILPVYESPDSLERAKGTGYSLHDLAGKVNLVFLSGAHSVLLRAGAVITRESNSTGFPRADLVNAKFTSKGSILSACQWLKASWLSLAVCFPKNRKGTALGPAATAFHGHPGGPCSGLQRVWGEKPEIRGYAGPGTEKTLGQDLNLLRTRQGPKRTSNKKNTVNSHGGMQDIHTAETPIQCLQQNYMEMSTSGLTPLFVV